MFDDVCTDQGGSKKKTRGGVGKKLHKFLLLEIKSMSFIGEDKINFFFFQQIIDLSPL